MNEISVAMAVCAQVVHVRDYQVDRRLSGHQGNVVEFWLDNGQGFRLEVTPIWGCAG